MEELRYGVRSGSDQIYNIRRYCNPTLVAMGSLTKQGQKEQEAYAHDPRVQQLLPQAAQERLCRCMGLGNESADAEHAYESVRQLKAAGIDIIM